MPLRPTNDTDQGARGHFMPTEEWNAYEEETYKTGGPEAPDDYEEEADHPLLVDEAHITPPKEGREA